MPKKVILAQNFTLDFYIVIPAHNESEYIGRTLESLAVQTLLPKKVVVVDDNSEDKTAEIARKFADKFPFLEVVITKSSEAHLPGSKVVAAFQKGLEKLDENYDVICKFDADLVFPKEYLESLRKRFEADPKLGMAGGFCYLLKDKKWVLESLTDRDHIRGALKAYRKQCFKDIGGLKASMGWDTVDELLAQYHGWKIKTDLNLRVKHLRPTGMTYDKKAKLKQGEAFYKLRYGLLISLIASGKLAMKKGEIRFFKDYLRGYFRARSRKMPFLVNKKEGAFIRRLRYRRMLSKITS